MNSLLAKMGYSPHDRVVIVHADDVGMCHASTTILPTLFGAGVVTSASVMVPCAWFGEAAAWAKSNPTADIGVHFTLTSEWQHYRWRALTTTTLGSGLVDDEGYFHRGVDAVFAQIDSIHAMREIQAQYQRAVAFGMRPSHCDSHMGTMFGVNTFGPYMSLSQQQRVPVFVPRLSEADLTRRGYDEATRTYQLATLQALEAQGVPVCDHMRFLDLGNPHQGLSDVKQLFAELPVGLTYFIGHPVIDTPEIRAIAPDWQARVRDFAVMTDPDLRAFVDAQGIHLIGWRDIQPHI
jgi:predicted glycoside hydrolase/deacetylase ChbG (UPF0249 family)